MSRRASLLALAVVLAAFPLAAQQKGDFTIAALASNISATYAETQGADVDAGFGVGISYSLAPQWSAELMISKQNSSFGGSIIETHFPDGTILMSRDIVRGTAYPFDLLGRYHFANSSRWKPYVGAGVHYVERPDFKSESGLPIFRGGLDANEVSAQINAGTLVMFGEHFGLRGDARYVLRGDNPFWDENEKFSLGLSWKF